jgi:hypothetical protein
MFANIGKVWKSEAECEKQEVKNTVIYVSRLRSSGFRLKPDWKISDHEF